MSLEQVAQRFRERSWPRTTPPPATSYLELAQRASEDPRPDVPDSFDDVVAAYGRGEITEEQYDVLGNAVAESIRNEYQREGQ
jgi:hypothetical protein